MTNTTKTEIVHIVDRSSWQPGPWDREPEDRIEWRDEATGLPCLMVRERYSGQWCGCVGVAPGHPWYGVNYSGSVGDDGQWVPSPVEARCHGGLTYAAPCQEGGAICHVPQPGEPDVAWWFGFDCGHCGDASPRDGERHWSSGSTTYRYRDYVRREVTELARQLAAITDRKEA